MNNNTNNSGGAIPEEVLELIPWYAIGNLSVDDQVLFEEALVLYPSLEKHIEIEQQMLSAVTANPALLEKSIVAPTEERLKSVLNMIDIEETQKQDSVKDNSFISKLKGSVELFIPSSGEPQYARIASLGALVLSVGVLTAFVMPLFNDNSDFIPASVEVSSNSEEAVTTNSSKISLFVGYNGSSTDLANNPVLKGKVLKVDSIPNKKGIYQVSFKPSVNAAEVKKILEALLSQKDLVWFAGEES